MKCNYSTRGRSIKDGYRVIGSVVSFFFQRELRRDVRTLSSTVDCAGASGIGESPLGEGSAGTPVGKRRNGKYPRNRRRFIYFYSYFRTLVSDDSSSFALTDTRAWGKTVMPRIKGRAGEFSATNRMFINRKISFVTIILMTGEVSRL